jgi:hypothetical protein
MSLVLLWILCGGVAAAMIAQNRGNSAGLWFIVGALFGPFGILFAFLSSGRTCPYCRSSIHPQATKCPKCQSSLTACPWCHADGQTGNFCVRCGRQLIPASEYARISQFVTRNLPAQAPAAAPESESEPSALPRAIRFALIAALVMVLIAGLVASLTQPSKSASNAQTESAGKAAIRARVVIPPEVRP